MPHSTRRRLSPTAVGAASVLIWSTLALLSEWSGALPPLQIVALSFCIAALIGLVYWLRVRAPVTSFRLEPALWVLGVGGLFGYHALYFLAVRLAPAVEANLLNYLWPLFIVLFSATLPGERIRWFHLAGAGLGFGGAAILVTGGRLLAVNPQYAPGYLAAVGAAITWAFYSVTSRRYGGVPTYSIAAFCAVAALIAGVLHILLEDTVRPSAVEWLAVTALGLGPVGGAFYTWDYGVKHGNIRLLGALSYAIPLLSTFLLVIAGRADVTPVILIACALIVSGAILAAGDSLAKRRSRTFQRGSSSSST